MRVNKKIITLSALLIIICTSIIIFNNEETEEVTETEVEAEEENGEEVELGKLKIKASIRFKQLLASEIEENKTEEENGTTE